jgi:hypothetical protein
MPISIGEAAPMFLTPMPGERHGPPRSYGQSHHRNVQQTRKAAKRKAAKNNMLISARHMTLNSTSSGSAVARARCALACARAGRGNCTSRRR